MKEPIHQPAVARLLIKSPAFHHPLLHVGRAVQSLESATLASTTHGIAFTTAPGDASPIRELMFTTDFQFRSQWVTESDARRDHIRCCRD